MAYKKSSAMSLFTTEVLKEEKKEVEDKKASKSISKSPKKNMDIKKSLTTKKSSDSSRDLNSNINNSKRAAVYETSSHDLSNEFEVSVTKSSNMAAPDIMTKDNENPNSVRPGSAAHHAFLKDDENLGAMKPELAGTGALKNNKESLDTINPVSTSADAFIKEYDNVDATIPVTTASEAKVSGSMTAATSVSGSKETWLNTSVTLTGENAVFLKKVAIFQKKTQTDFLYEIMKKEYELHKEEVENPFEVTFEPIPGSFMRPKKNSRSLSIRLPREIMDFITLYALTKGISKSSYVDDVITSLRESYNP